MSEPRTFPLESIRTDGWFERIGEGIGSFQALCDIIGPRFFAFAMITGARITALTVDRRNPDNTLVDFVVGGAEGEAMESESQRLTLGDFRRRLVSALAAEDPIGPPPQRPTDTEAVQLHIGVRYLLLAPLYGYSLRELITDDSGSHLTMLHDGVEASFELEAFRARIRSHLHEELTRVQRGPSRGSIELSRVAEAESAAEQGDHVKVVELLGRWPAPLAIFLRTPEGQLLSGEARATIAKGLGMLGSACIALQEVAKGEEVLRLAVQYAGDSSVGADIYVRLGEAMLSENRLGEAIAPLRRAVNLGASGARVWPQLAHALARRGRAMAALGAVLEARAAGADAERLAPIVSELESKLGPALDRWRALVGPAEEPSGSSPLHAESN